MLLKILNRVELGKYIRKVASDPIELGKLTSNPNKVLNQFVAQELDLSQNPSAPGIHIHVSTKKIMHVTIPHSDDVNDALTDLSYSYPIEYDKTSGAFIDPVSNRDDAVNLRVGDYTMNVCAGG